MGVSGVGKIILMDVFVGCKIGGIMEGVVKVGGFVKV